MLIDIALLGVRDYKSVESASQLTISTCIYKHNIPNCPNKSVFSLVLNWAHNSTHTIHCVRVSVLCVCVCTCTRMYNCKWLVHNHI